jgi:hypothetical protein
MGCRPGCGFYIHPLFLVTCAHVVGRDVFDGASIEAQAWGETPYRTVVQALSPTLDLALLRAPLEGSSFAPVSQELRLREPVFAFGYPAVGNSAEQDQITACVEGETWTISDEGQDRSLLKLKHGQIEPGFSGGPVISERTGKVAGILCMTRDARSDLGGWAITVSSLLQLCQEHQIDLPKPSDSWRKAYAEAESLRTQSDGATDRQRSTISAGFSIGSRDRGGVAHHNIRSSLKELFHGPRKDAAPGLTCADLTQEIRYLARDILALHEDPKRRNNVGDVSLPRLISELKSIQAATEIQGKRGPASEQGLDGSSLLAQVAEARDLVERIAISEDVDEMATAAALLGHLTAMIVHRFRHCRETN